MALSLAYYEYYEESGGKAAAAGEAPVLDVKQFETMHAITTSFEDYCNSVRDATDAELALQTETRNDRFSDGVTKHWQNEYRDLSLREARAASAKLETAGDIGGGGGDPDTTSTSAPPRTGMGMAGGGLSFETGSMIGDQTRLHPRTSIPSHAMRPRSSSQLSASSPPNISQWRGQGPPP